MKKKRLIFTITTAVLVLALATTSFAAIGIGDPATTSIGTQTNIIPAYGYVGPDAHLTPGIPPTVQMLEATVPAAMLWAAFAGDYSGGQSNLRTAVHPVTLASTSSPATLSFQSYTKTGGADIPVGSTLTLGLHAAYGVHTTGSILNADVASLLSASATDLASMVPGETVNLTFTGNLANVSAFPTTPLLPQYSMVLKLTLT